MFCRSTHENSHEARGGRGGNATSTAADPGCTLLSRSPIHALRRLTDQGFALLGTFADVEENVTSAPIWRQRRADELVPGDTVMHRTNGRTWDQVRVMSVDDDGQGCVRVTLNRAGVEIELVCRNAETFDVL